MYQSRGEITTVGLDSSVWDIVTGNAVMNSLVLYVYLK